MERENPVSEGIEQALALFSEKTDLVAFDNLLSYATNACLDKKPEYLTLGEESKHEPKSQEHKVIHNAGARALRTLIEFELGHFDRHKDSHDTPHSPRVNEALAEPYAFSGVADNRILENTERFGRALIDQSFAILGSGAETKAHELRNATTTEDQIAAIRWLSNRLTAMSKKDTLRTSDDESQKFYPPYRLSPKIIGTYPNINVSPSCLASSIIATSFFEKANIPVLQASVNATAADGPGYYLSEALYAAQSQSITPGQREAVGKLAEQTDAWIHRETARHAAVYIRLHDTWMQFDPLLGATVVLSQEEYTAKLDKLKQTLDNWLPVMPNLELSLGLVSMGGFMGSNEYCPLSAALLFSDKEPSSNPQAIVDSVFDNLPDESSISHLYESFFIPILNNNYEMTPESAIVKSLELYEPDKQDEQEYLMYTLFEHCFRKYVLWESSWEEFTKRIAIDPEYKQRRIEDFLGLPTMVGILAAKRGADLRERASCHPNVDVGSPAMRVGMSVLSDFAQYDNHPLSINFWMKHWAGDAAVYESLHIPPENPYDAGLLFNNILLQAEGPVANMSNHDMIMEFLHTHDKGVINGNQEEGS